MHKKFLPVGLGLVLVIGSAYVHGVMTDRWGEPADLSKAAAKLDKLPTVLGDWHSQPLEMSEGQLRGAEAVGHFSRAFRNDKTQTEIQVLVLCGPHGPIAVHPPTICFTGAGLQQAYPEKKQAVDAGKVKGDFWRTKFTKRSPDGVRSELETYWAWSTAGICEASDNPRLEYATSPHLYKIYVTQQRRTADGAIPEDNSHAACEDFLKLFLPAFQAVLSES